MARKGKKSTSITYRIAVAGSKSAAKALQAPKAALSGLSKQIDLTAKVGASSFRGLGAGLVVWNQGLDLSRKLLEAWKLTLGKAIETSLAFRKEGDGTRETFEQLKRSVDLLWARVGDALLPTFLALADTMQPIIDKAVEWLTANNNLVSSRVVEWATRLGEIFARWIVPAISLTMQAFVGLKLILRGNALAISALASTAIEGFGWIVKAASRLAAAMGKDELAARLDEFSGSITVLGGQVDEFAGKMIDGIKEDILWIREIDKTAKEFGKGFETAVGKFAVAAQKRLATATVGTNKRLEEQRAALQKIREEEIKRLEIDAKARELAKLKVEQWKAEQEAFFQAHAPRMQMLQDNLAATIEGAQTAGDAARNVLKSLGVEAAGMVMRWVFNTVPPPASFVAAPAAGAAALGLISRLANEIPSFHTGGLIGERDGVRTAGMRADERLIVAQTGERVLSRSETAAAASAPSTPVNLSINFSSAFPPTESQARAIVDALGPRIADLVNRGRMVRR